MNFLQKLGNKIDKALEDKEYTMLRRNDLNEIKAYLNNDVLFKLYLQIDTLLKSEKWAGQVKTDFHKADSRVNELKITTDEGVVYEFDLRLGVTKTVKNLNTNYTIELEDAASFFRKYARIVHFEIQQKELERFI